MAETVTIKIDVKADTAAIERVRAQLKALCSEVDDCTKTHEKHTKSLDDMSDAHKRTARDLDKNTKGIKDYGNQSQKSGKQSNVFWKDFLDFSKMPGMMLGGFQKLIKFGFKYLAIEAAAAAAVLATSTLLFKTGSFFAKSYQMALSGAAYGLAAFAAAAAVAIAAQRQFQSVQFAPQYSEGAINTTDKFEAASQAMKMFVDDTQMAVLGSKALTGAFRTLSEQAPVTGETTGAFRALSNYTAGIGGDMEKSSQALAKFMAKFQKDKTMTEGVKAAGKELGPDFKKILDEANKLGANTYSKFATAAMNGELGKTFQKYAGQLTAVNSTLIGQGKQAIGEIKAMFTELGDPLLAPVTKALQKVVNVVEVMFIRMRGNVENFGATSLLENMVNLLTKAAYFVGDLLTNKLGKANESFGKIKDMFNTVRGFFEKIQDFFRPLQAAGQVLIDAVAAIGSAMFGNFVGTIEQMGSLLTDNRDKIMSFANSVGGLLKQFGEMGAVIKEAVVGALPAITALIKGVTFGINIITKGLKAIMSLSNIFGKVGASILTLIAAAVGMRALKSAKKALDTQSKNLYAKVVNVYSSGSGGPWSTGGKGGGGGMGPGGSGGTGGSGRTLGQRFPKTAKIGRGAGKAIDQLGGGAMIATIGGQAIESISGRNDIGHGIGASVKYGGMAAMGANLIGQGAYAGPVGMAAAGMAASGYAGKYIGEHFFKDDSVKSRLGAGLAGATAGAGIGAVVGNAIPIPGVGAAVGAVVGGIIGGVTGFITAGKHRKEARKAASAIVDGYSSSIEEAVKNGDLDALSKASMEASSQAKAMLEKGGYSATAIKNKQKEIEALDKKVQNYNSNADLFATYAGKDADAMNQILTQLGKDGTAEVVNILDMMRESGQDAWDTIGPMMDDFNGKLLEARLAMFDAPLQMSEAAKAVDAAQAKLLGGDKSRESVTDFLKKDFTYLLSKTGGDALKAQALQEESFKTAFGPGGALEGLGDSVMTAYDQLGLSDYGKLLDQVITTGKLQFQAKLIANQSGISESEASMLLARNYLQNGAAGGVQNDELFRNMVLGRTSGLSVVAGLQNTDTANAILTGAAEEERITNQEILKRQRQRGQTSTPNGYVVPTGTATTNQYNIGGSTVQVTGILDEKMAKKIAEEIAKINAKAMERKGK